MLGSSTKMWITTFKKEVSFDINNFDEKDWMKMCDFIDRPWECMCFLNLIMYV